MADTVYIAERQVEYWTSRQIEDFFFDAGFDITVFPVTQRVENYLPVDFIFGSGGPVKLFGLQYKVLYHNAQDHWKLTNHQHSEIGRYPWMYYGLSDLTSATDFRNSLHYLRLADADFDFTSKLDKSTIYDHGYVRWRSFFQGLQNCPNGEKVESKSRLKHALTSYTEELPDKPVNQIVDIFAANFDDQRLVHLSSQLRTDFLDREE